MNNNIHVLARAVIVDQNHILLAYDPRPHPQHYYEFDRQFYHLPGGHIEFKESAKNALVREIKEVIQSFKALWEYSKQDNRNRWMLFFYFFNSILTAPLKKWMG